MTKRLLDYLTSARWFGGKGRAAQLIGVTALPWLRPPGKWPAIRQEIAEVGYSGSADHEFYQLLISYQPVGVDHGRVIIETDDPDHGWLSGVDGTEDPAAHAALLDLLLSKEKTGDLLAHRTGDDRLTAGLPSRVFGGEQSNTSILFAHQSIMKLFRRIEIGRNLDIETHQVLTRVGSPDAAKLYGWIEASWTSPDKAISYGADLAMITELLEGARDGWEYALAELRAGRDFGAEARRLGQALAGVHEVLRGNFPTDTVAGDQLAVIMTERLQAAVEVAPQLEAYVKGLTATFSALAGTDLAVQRVHGDFHLGQALHTPYGWKIIDFEGEPAKTLVERSRPDSIWRDIAGALRSFDYAAAHHPGASPWADQCRRNFLLGYGRPEDHQVLRAYLADKAIYEVVYESRNRPDWVQIPLTAIAALAREEPA